MGNLYRAKTENYIHRKVADSDVLISVGGNIASFNGYIELNPAAALLWDAMKTEKTEGELIAALLSEFDIDKETASKDTKEFLENLKAHDMVDVL